MTAAIDSTALPDLIGYGLAFVGGVLVAGLTVWGSFALASVEWKRVETRRLSESRRVAYAAYAREVKDEIRICRQIAASLGVAKSRAPLTREDGRNALAEISPRRSAALEDILLVGSQGLAEQARLWKFAQQQLENRVLRQPVVPASEYKALYAKAGHARDLFYDAARSDLAVAGKIRLTTRADRQSAYEALPEYDH
jgi:hypothetical protein